ncbi:hypothetical protein ACQJBY_022648 [Aegilops geniculata]
MAMAMASLQDVQQQIFEYNGYTPYSRWSGMSAAPVQVSCANQSPPQVLDGTPGTSSACSPTRVTGTLKGYDLLLNLVLDEAVESEREGELEELEKGVEPAWECLVHPLERIVDGLNVVDHIKAVKDSPDLCAAVEDVQMVASIHVSS